MATARAPKNGHKNDLRKLTREEGLAMFERACKYYLNMTSEDFLRRYEAGELNEDSGQPEVEHVALLIPFVR